MKTESEKNIRIGTPGFFNGNVAMVVTDETACIIRQIKSPNGEL